jgi:hypothetical protein
MGRCREWTGHMQWGLFSYKWSLQIWEGQNAFVASLRCEGEMLSGLLLLSDKAFNGNGA